MLAGVDLAALPADRACDVLWAAFCDFAGPGEHILDLWAEITGEHIDRPDGATTATAAPTELGGEPGEQRQAAVAAVTGLSDEDLEAWVPAWTDDTITDEQFDDYWAHTAKFAAGQDALVKFARAAPRVGEGQG